MSTARARTPEMPMQQQPAPATARTAAPSIDDRVKSISTLITSKAMLEQFRSALPKRILPERFARVAMTAVRRDQKLALCSQPSFLAALMNAAQLGLEPGVLGQCWILPFNGEAQLIIGYRGLIQLAWRSGQVADIYGHAVHDGDLFDWQLGTERWIKHRPKPDTGKEASRITHSYAVFEPITGGRKSFRVLELVEIDRHRLRSPAVRAGKKTPWDTDFEEMAIKTAFLALLKWAPLSVELERALELDEASHAGMAAAIDVEFSSEANKPASLDEVLSAGTTAESQNGTLPCPECAANGPDQCSIHASEAPAPAHD